MVGEFKERQRHQFLPSLKKSEVHVPLNRLHIIADVVSQIAVLLMTQFISERGA